MSGNAPGCGTSEKLPPDISGFRCGLRTDLAGGYPPAGEWRRSAGAPPQPIDEVVLTVAAVSSRRPVSPDRSGVHRHPAPRSDLRRRAWGVLLLRGEAGSRPRKEVAGLPKGTGSAQGYRRPGRRRAPEPTGVLPRFGQLNPTSARGREPAETVPRTRSGRLSTRRDGVLPRRRVDGERSPASLAPRLKVNDGPDWERLASQAPDRRPPGPFDRCRTSAFVQAGTPPPLVMGVKEALDSPHRRARVLPAGAPYPGPRWTGIPGSRSVPPVSR